MNINQLIQRVANEQPAIRGGSVSVHEVRQQLYAQLSDAMAAVREIGEEMLRDDGPSAPALRRKWAQAQNEVNLLKRRIAALGS